MIDYWVTAGRLPDGEKVAGPFMDEDTAFAERARIETAEGRDDLWIQQDYPREES